MWVWQVEEQAVKVHGICQSGVHSVKVLWIMRLTQKELGPYGVALVWAKQELVA